MIRHAIDLHVHIGPEIIPRRYTNGEHIITELSGRIGGVALKNHFFSTVPTVAAIKSTMTIVGSVVLNNFVGGLNPDAIYAASTLAKSTFIVWFPTISAKQFLDKSEWEVSPEWVDPRIPFIARMAKNIRGIQIISEKKRLTLNTIKVLTSIKKTNAILATGHISWRESKELIKSAANMGINKIIITHPIYQRINMPIAIQRELTKYGAKIEHSWSMWMIDKISIKRIVGQMITVGPENCIITSDSGQSMSPSPDLALLSFSKALLTQGISIKALEIMLVTNPKKLICQ